MTANLLDRVDATEETEDRYSGDESVPAPEVEEADEGSDQGVDTAEEEADEDPDAAEGDVEE